MSALKRIRRSCTMGTNLVDDARDPMAAPCNTSRGRAIQLTVKNTCASSAVAVPL